MGVRRGMRHGPRHRPEAGKGPIYTWWTPDPQSPGHRASEEKGILPVLDPKGSARDDQSSGPRHLAGRAFPLKEKGIEIIDDHLSQGGPGPGDHPKAQFHGIHGPHPRGREPPEVTGLLGYAGGLGRSSRGRGTCRACRIRSGSASSPRPRRTWRRSRKRRRRSGNASRSGRLRQPSAIPR